MRTPVFTAFDHVPFVPAVRKEPYHITTAAYGGSSDKSRTIPKPRKLLNSAGKAPQSSGTCHGKAQGFFCYDAFFHQDDRKCHETRVLCGAVRLKRNRGQVKSFGRSDSLPVWTESKFMGPIGPEDQTTSVSKHESTATK